MIVYFEKDGIRVQADSLTRAAHWRALGYVEVQAETVSVEPPTAPDLVIEPELVEVEPEPARKEKAVKK